MTEENGKHKVEKGDRDFEKEYPISETVAKLRRLADCLEEGKPFEIMIGGERIYVPVKATFNIEHERGSGYEEIEFQFKWSTETKSGGVGNG